MQLAKTGLGINSNAPDKLDSQLVDAEVCRHPRGWCTASGGNWGLLAIPAHDS